MTCKLTASPSCSRKDAFSGQYLCPFCPWMGKGGVCEVDKFPEFGACLHRKL
jgi:hypothetical protein